MPTSVKITATWLSTRRHTDPADHSTTRPWCSSSSEASIETLGDHLHQGVSNCGPCVLRLTCDEIPDERVVQRWYWFIHGFISCSVTR
jgi:hypothetical protein